jgi:hypothetical protein
VALSPVEAPIVAGAGRRLAVVALAWRGTPLRLRKADMPVADIAARESTTYTPLARASP